jgi:crotonobetainyl-CoA:carnitine CoA-transferase CaiB-like acyl-CoA transferase
MLDGLRVLDLSDASGAFCGRILADLGADVVAVPPGEDSPYQTATLAANKRIVGTDPAGLLAGADIVIQTEPRLRYEDVARANRGQILVTMTPYGPAGPISGAAASDLEITAASGCLWLAGEAGRTPVRTTLPQSSLWTGMYAAMGALVALSARAGSGRGQHVDVSAQASMATVHPPAIIFWETLREEHRRLGPHLMGRSILGAKFRNIWPCADGYVAFAIQGGPIGRHTGRMLAEWMAEKGALDDVVATIDWDRFDNRLLPQDEVDRLEASVGRFLLLLTKREFFAGVLARNMLGYPVADARDILQDEQLKARKFWQEIELDGRRLRFPGGFALFDGERPRIRAATREHGAPGWRGAGVPSYSRGLRGRGPWRGNPRAPLHLSRSEAGTPRSAADTPAPRPPETTPRADASALGGIRVVEFGWAAAGPLVGKYLANHGAEVIHVESGTALDPFRSTYPPFKGEPSPNTAAMFAFYNDGKKGVTLNLRHPKAVELALRLVAKADVLVESFPAGTLARRGLTTQALCRARRDLIVLSSCNQGQTGPHAQHPGYGSQLTALAGFNELLGERGRTPVILYGPYIDYIAVAYGVIAILAALERRRRTGAGCLIDLSQYEAGLQFMAPALLEHGAQGTVPTRDGNHDPVARPHGVYRCAGEDRWVALSIWTEDEWARFRSIVGHFEWSRDDPGLDGCIEEWTSTRSQTEIVDALREERLRAAPVATIAELADDAQLRHRSFWRTTRHPLLREVVAMAPPFLLSDTPAVLERAGPTLGEHNDEVWRALGGIDEAEYRALAAEGVFD